MAYPAVSMDNNGDFAVTWREFGYVKDKYYYIVMLQTYNKQGIPEINPIEVEYLYYTTTALTTPDVAMNDIGDIVVTWRGDTQNPDILAKTYRSDGTSHGPITVNAYTRSIQEQPAVAMDANGGFTVAWQCLEPPARPNDHPGDGWNLFARTFAPTATPSSEDLIAYTSGLGAQVSPDVASDADGNFVVVWQSESLGVVGQRFASSGQRLGEEFRISPGTEGRLPSVAMSTAGVFVVAWMNGAFVQARRYDAAGGVQGDIITVASGATNPTVAMADDGRFVVGWESADDVYAAQFQPDGQPAGDSFRVNTQTDGLQRRPSIGMSDDGDVVVVWESADDIYMQRYMAAPVSTESAPAGVLTLTIAPNPSGSTSEAPSAYLSLTVPMVVRVTLVDALGRTVAVLNNGSLSAGRHRLALPSLAPGTYVVHAVSSAGDRMARLTVVR